MQCTVVTFSLLFALSTSAVSEAFTALPQKRLLPSLRTTVALETVSVEEVTILLESSMSSVQLEEQDVACDKASTVAFAASSEILYHLPTLWSDEVKAETVPPPDLLSLESLSVYSTSDQSSVVSTGVTSLAALLNVGPPYTTFTRGFSSRPLVVGHRGSLYEEPENTVASFQKSADLGCDAVELDVFLLKCGTLVVFHGDGNNENPGHLQDYCGLDGSILDYTAEQARSLPFSPHANVYPCPSHKLETATIPTLEQVLENARETGIIVKIELKGHGTEVPALELVERMGMVHQCHFASFCHDRVARIRQLRPQRHADGTHVYKTGCLFDGEVPYDFVQCALSVGASEVHLRYDTCTRERVDAIHQAGMGSMAWFSGPRAMKEDAERFHDVGNEDIAMYQTVCNSGVGAMCINRPDTLLSMFEELRK